MDEKYGLKCCGKGGALMDKVNIVSLSFQSKEKQYSVEETRRLMVKCVEEYLERINDDEDIRPYLSHYPFSSLGVDFDISFQGARGNEIRLAFLSEDNIVYMVVDPNQKPYIRKHKETYNEAREIVMAEGLGLSQADSGLQ